jgi:hypothetical protein
MRVPYGAQNIILSSCKKKSSLYLKKIWFLLMSTQINSINSSVYKYRLFVTNNLEDSFFVLHYNWFYCQLWFISSIPLPREENTSDEIYLTSFRFTKDKMMSTYVDTINTYNIPLCLQKPKTFCWTIYIHILVYIYVSHMLYQIIFIHILIEYLAASCRVIN